MSFDLVSDHAFVIEADIFERLPLPGSEEGSDEGDKSSQGYAQIVNVVVCALSLMGTNWPNCIREAWRILRPECVFDFNLHTRALSHLHHWTSGELKIAEVASRFTNVQRFQSFVESFGFRHQSTVCALYTRHSMKLSAQNTG
jgi:ribosomal RNA-processing protein 8